VRAALQRLLALVRRTRLDYELDAEVRAHLELAERDARLRGLSAEDARREARLAFGGLDGIREAHRDARALPALESVVADVRYALRGLWHARAFTLVAVAILAIGIGANTAVFSIVNAVVLRSLPFPDAARLVWITPNTDDEGMTARTYPVRVVEEMQRHSTSFEDMAAYFAFFDYASYTLTGHGDPERLAGVPVGPRFFELLGVQPLHGRTFTAEELALNGPPAAILTHGLWQRRFASDPAIIGQAVTISEAPFTVVGVLPQTFDFASVFLPGTRVDLFVPVPFEGIRDFGNTLSVVGRLRPGVALETARAEFTELMPRLNAENQGWGTRSARLVGLDAHVNGRVQRSLLVLWGAVGLVLLIVCANLSGLLLARTASRGREIAVRLAIGAGRARVIRQLLTESAVLSLLGAGLGVPLAYWLVAFVKSSTTWSVPLLHRVEVDAVALGFTAAVAIVVSGVFGILPATRVASGDPQRTLRDQARGSTQGRGHAWLRSGLVVVEVALACVLLVGAGLLVRSFLQVQAVDLGFTPSHAMAIRVNTSPRLDADARRVLLGEIARRVAALPGVEAMSLTDALPLDRNRTWGIDVPGMNFPPGTAPVPFVYVTGPGYFETMGIAVRQGRDFSDRDAPDTGPVLIVSESLAGRLWPGLDPIGRTARAGRAERTVIGVVADVRQASLEEGGAHQMYFSYAQVADFFGMDVVLRSSLPPATMAPAVRGALRMLDPTLSATDVRALDTFVDRATSPRRFLVTLLAGFSVLALVLACLGIYSTVSYGVTDRVREFGVRMALGATANDIRSGVLRGTLLVVLIGVAVGAAASFVVTRLMAALLFQTSTTDVATFASAAAVLLGVALMAGYVPAVRASRVSPMEALRNE